MDGNGYRCRGVADALRAVRTGRGAAFQPGSLERPVRGEPAEAAPGRAPGAGIGAAAEAASGRCAGGRARCGRGRKPDAGPPSDKPAEPAAAAPPPSACRLALTEAIAIAPSIPDIHGAGGCGGEDLVRLEAVVLPDKRQVAVKPAAILRCTMASAIADWIRTDIAPLAASLGSAISGLDNFNSFECRGRNRVVGAQLSEHGRANALDVRALKLANGQSISLTDRTVPRELRESVLHSVCARFSTVLGPGSDGYHEDHIHLDLMERHNNYKICQWNVWDSAAADRAAAAGRAAGRRAAARGRRQIRRRETDAPPSRDAPADSRDAANKKAPVNRRF